MSEGVDQQADRLCFDTFCRLRLTKVHLWAAVRKEIVITEFGSGLPGYALRTNPTYDGGLQGMDDFISVQPLALLQGQHIEFGRIIEQAAVVGAGFHQQGKARHLCGSIINVKAVEVLFQNQARNGTKLVTAFKINGFEYIVGHHQDVAAAAGRVEDGDGFRVEAAAVFIHSRLGDRG